jgi:hypothetical protein
LAKAPRGYAQIRLEQPLELDEWLLVKDNPIERRKLCGPFAQTIGDCLTGKRGIVLQPREPLLLGRRNNVPILHERCGTIVIVSGYPEETHSSRQSF